MHDDTSFPRLSDAVFDGLLGERAHVRLPGLLSAAQCAEIAGLFDEDARYRASVDMARHRFGEGRYRYFARPLPGLVAALQEALYRRLVPVAEEMQSRMRRSRRYPASLEDYAAACAAAGQARPTCLLLRYEAGGYNCLHQDRYGEEMFPLQATVCLDSPGRDYEGGEFLLVRNRPRQQSVAEAVALAQGEMIVFPSADFPARGARGFHRCSMRHGVSRLHRGRRHALGLIFHDAA